MSENDGDMELAKGSMKLTSREEAFARLIALEGLDQSSAYRQTHNVSPGLRTYFSNVPVRW